MATDTPGPAGSQPARVNSWSASVGEIPPQGKIAIIVTVCFLLIWMVMSLSPAHPQAAATAVPATTPITSDDRAARERAEAMSRELEDARKDQEAKLASLAAQQKQREADGLGTDHPAGGRTARVTTTTAGGGERSASTGEARTVTPGRINHRAPAATPGNLAAQDWLQNTLGARPVAAPHASAVDGPASSPVAAPVAPAGSGATIAATTPWSTPVAPVATLTPTTLQAGHIIETVLANRLNSTAAGPAIVRVRVPVYGYDGSVLLIPQGATILGMASPVGSLYDSRMTVAFHQLQMPPPDGRVYSLDQFKGLSVIGDIGLRDQVNNHYLSIFGASAAVGLVTGAAQWATAGRSGGNNNVVLGGFGQEWQQTANIVLQRFINRPPDLVERPGDRVSVYVTQNLELPPWGKR